MINSSTDFATVVAGDDREFTSRLSVNGTELDGSIDTWTLTKGSCGGSEFVVGSVMGSVFTCTIKNLTANVKNEDIKVEIGLMVNGAYEYITLGYFTASEVKKTPYQTAITAYGHSVSKTGGVISSLSTQTLASVRQALSVATGVSVTLPSSVDTTLTIDESLAGMTGYQILQVLASVIGGYVVDEADGSIGIKLYNATPTLTVSEDRMLALPDVEEQNFTITGISCTAGENTYTSGTVNVEMDNEFMTSDLFTNECAPNLIGYSYRPATITLSKGDPRLEGIDVLGVGSYAVPCHSVSHTFDGGLSTRVESIRATMIGDGEATPAPISTKIKDNEKKITTIGKIASDTNQYFWFNGTGTDTGAHISEVPQDEFTDPTSASYHTGGNLLARSNGIAVRDGLDELATFSATGAQIGKDDGAHSVIDNDGMQIYAPNTGDDSIVRVAQFGYGEGYDENGNLAYAPFYDLGRRFPNSAVGNYSVVEGFGIASGSSSHAQGVALLIDGVVKCPTASGSGSHAQGYAPTASGSASFATGYKTEATGFASVAMGDSTIASSQSQVALGRNNIEDANSKYAFIIGNGASNARSNALTVDWSGGITVGNHSSSIGTIRSANLKNNKSVANNTATALLDLELDAGTWVAIVGVRFPSNSTGYRKVNISATSGANDAQYLVPPTSGDVTQIVYPKILTPTATTTYYLNVRHTAGTSLSMPGGNTLWANYIQAIRIL